MAGAPVTIEVDGETWEMGSMVLEDFGEVENELLAMRKSPLEAVREEIEKLKNPEHQEMLLKIAYADMKKGYKGVSPREISDYIDTPAGAAFTLWLCLKKKRPDVTREKAQEIFTALGNKALEEIKRKRDLAAGMGEQGNSTGQSPPAEAKPRLAV
jgi:hypothetical protein